MLANWDNVLRAISLASSKHHPNPLSGEIEEGAADLKWSGEGKQTPVSHGTRTRTNAMMHLGKASSLDEAAGPETEDQPETRLPATLVRIPAETTEKVGE